MENLIPNTLDQTIILVVGDVVVDRYEWGVADRISREAPIPVVDIVDVTDRLGGAGNVAANIAGLGCEVRLVCALDPNVPPSIPKLIQDHGIVDSTISAYGYRPAIKTRVMVNNQQVNRRDYKESGLPSSCGQSAIQTVVSSFKEIDAVVVANPANLLRQPFDNTSVLIKLCKEAGLPIFIDPQLSNWRGYTGATCLTPNLQELSAAYGRPVTKDSLIDAAHIIVEEYDLKYLLVTMGPEGMALFSRNSPPVFIPTHAKEVFDVSGAGDTVIAALASFVGAGAGYQRAANLSNLAAGKVVEKLGTGVVHIQELQDHFHRPDSLFTQSTWKIRSESETSAWVHQWRQQEYKIIFTNGCFDLLHPGHVSLLNQAKKLGGKLVVGLNTDASIRRIKGENRPVLSGRDRAALLCALEDVDSIVFFQEDTPEKLIKTLKPDILVKGADYTKDEVVGRKFVESYGGRIHLADLLPGYSTTDIVDQIKMSGTGG